MLTNIILVANTFHVTHGRHAAMAQVGLGPHQGSSAKAALLPASCDAIGRGDEPGEGVWAWDLGRLHRPVPPPLRLLSLAPIV